MTLKHYLLSAKKENLTLLFWLLVNTGCLLLHGLLSSKAVTDLVALNLNQFLLNCAFILANSFIWMIQIRQVTTAREKAIQTMNTNIRKDISQTLADCHYQTFHQKDTTTYTSWMTNDIQTIQDFGFETLELMISQVLNVIGAAATLTLYHPSFLVSLLLLTALMGIIPKLFSVKLAEKTNDFSAKNEALTKTITDVLNGYDILKNAGKSNHISQKIEKASLLVKMSKITYARLFGTMMASQNATSFFSQLTVLTQAGLLFYWHLIPIGLVAQAQYFASITFAGLTGFFANYSELKTTAEIFSKFDLLRTPPSKNKCSTFVSDCYLKNISFQYGKNKIIQNFSLSFKKGEKISLTSPSGKGKSTLLKLLASQLYPQTGDIFVDGQTVDNLPLDQIVELVPQHVHLFDDSLRFNLTFGEPIPDDVLYRTLKDFQLDEFINDDLDRPLIKEGSDLSGGQKQRIALARAYLQNKPILLLDEATSAIDINRAQKILDFLLQQPDKTIIYATHHLNQSDEQKFNQTLQFQPFINKSSI